MSNGNPHPSSSGASDQASPPSANSPPLPGLNPRSCVTCRRRKVKCDKREPCGNCTKARIACIFPSPGRAPRKARKPPDAELLERLRKLESVVQNLGTQVEEDSAPKPVQVDDERENFQQLRKVAHTPGQPQRSVSEISGGITSTPELNVPGLENKFGRLVVNEGKSRYINSSFWANLNAEVEDLREIIEESEDEVEYSTPSSDARSNQHQNFILGYSSSNVDLGPLHPPPDLLPRYWNHFRENVDPLAKVLHIPTIEPKILEAANHLGSLPKGLETLLFTIYYGVVTSLSAADCMLELGEQKPILLDRYRFGVEQALARAHFLDSQEIIVLQAFVLFLILLRRNDDARIIWTLVGLVVRMAQTIGLHRDGTHFNLAPFEIEMRRRLWWQVCILDARASEDHGSDPTIVEAQFDTQMPLNVNDFDLHPDMKELPESRKGFTEMTFCIIRFEVANIFRRIVYVPPGTGKCQSFFANLSIEQKQQWITDCNKRLEETYLSHVDMTVPLYWVTATVSRLVLCKMWIVVYHPYQRSDGGISLPQEIKDKLFITSLESVEYSILLETEERTRKWEWLFKTYVQWQSLAYMLSELCVRTRGETVARAWKAIEATVASRFASPFCDHRKAYLWRPLRRLMLKARAAREHDLYQQRAELQSQSQLNGMPAQLPNPLSCPAEACPVIDSLLQQSGSPWETSPTSSTKTLTPGAVPPVAQRMDSTASSNSAAEDLTQLSSMGMDWLIHDLRQDTSLGDPNDLVNWSTWDDMVRQCGSLQGEDPNGIGSGIAAELAGMSGMSAGMGGTWF